MNLPALCFGLLWVPALGWLFYAWRGRGGCLWFLATPLFAGLGFGLGHGLALRYGWTWGRVGPWALGPALVGAGLTLFVAMVLLAPRVSHKGKTQAFTPIKRHHI